MNKTEKFILMHKLEAKVQCNTPPDNIDVVLVDAVFLLHILLNLPLSFGEIASLLRSKLCEMAPQVHLIGDSYLSLSRKDAEHQRHGSDEAVFGVTGSEQRRPKDWQKALRSPSFKTSFFCF